MHSPLCKAAGALYIPAQLMHLDRNTNGIGNTLQGLHEFSALQCNNWKHQERLKPKPWIFKDSRQLGSIKQL